MDSSTVARGCQGQDAPSWCVAQWPYVARSSSARLTSVSDDCCMECMECAKIKKIKNIKAEHPSGGRSPCTDPAHWLLFLSFLPF